MRETIFYYLKNNQMIRNEFYDSCFDGGIMRVGRKTYRKSLCILFCYQIIAWMMNNWYHRQCLIRSVLFLKKRFKKKQIPITVKVCWICTGRGPGRIKQKCGICTRMKIRIEHQSSSSSTLSTMVTAQLTWNSSQAENAARHFSCLYLPNSS